jgi:hypothetical protein
MKKYNKPNIIDLATYVTSSSLQRSGWHNTRFNQLYRRRLGVNIHNACPVEYMEGWEKLRKEYMPGLLKWVNCIRAIKRHKL